MTAETARIPSISRVSAEAAGPLRGLIPGGTDALTMNEQGAAAGARAVEEAL
jgi:hypothetical protein